MRILPVGKNEAGQRLDKLLIKYMPSAGKGFIYKMLRKKNIVLNDRKASGNEILAENDSIKLWMADETIDKFRSAPERVVKTDMVPDIIYEDEDIILVNKPAGILSQKATESDISINEVLLGYMLDTGELTPDQMKTFRPSVCNRLDRNTSGLLFFGKSLRGLQYVSEMLRNRSCHKDYLAAVRGEIREERDIRTEEEGKLLHSTVKPVYVNRGQSLVMVRLHTGKTHQIRKHLSEMGCPILGDRKYGDGKGAARQLLHAYRVTFPDGRRFTAELPEDFLKWTGDKWEPGKLADFGNLPWRI